MTYHLPFACLGKRTSGLALEALVVARATSKKIGWMLLVFFASELVGMHLHRETSPLKPRHKEYYGDYPGS